MSDRHELPEVAPCEWHPSAYAPTCCPSCGARNLNAYIKDIRRILCETQFVPGAPMSQFANPSFKDVWQFLENERHVVLCDVCKEMIMNFEAIDAHHEMFLLADAQVPPDYTMNSRVAVTQDLEKGIHHFEFNTDFYEE